MKLLEDIVHMITTTSTSTPAREVAFLTDTEHSPSDHFNDNNDSHYSSRSLQLQQQQHQEDLTLCDDTKVEIVECTAVDIVTGGEVSHVMRFQPGLCQVNLQVSVYRVENILKKNDGRIDQVVWTRKLPVVHKK